MKHPVVRIPLSLLLALLILFGGTAKEFVHQFTGHTDTVHTSCTSSCAETKDGLAFHTPHHHCDFLQLALAAFTDTPVFDWLPAPLLLQHISSHQPASNGVVLSVVVASYQGRGPPAFLS